MEHEEIQRQEGLSVSWSAPASLLPGVLARLEQRQSATTDRSLDALRVQLVHPQWEVRAAAVRALAEHEAQTTENVDTIRELMLQALQDEHRLVRVAAVRALSRLGTDVPFDRLLLCLRDPDWEVREIAVLVLGELSGQHLDPLQALLQVAQQDTHSSVREAATYALHMYHNREVHNNTASVQKIEPKLDTRLFSFLTRYLHIFARQIPLIHKSIWFVAPILLLMWFIENMPLLSGVGRNIHEAGLFLALFATVSAGVGSTFIYGSERDAAFELTLSTPTSLRILMLCRFLLVVGYNILLAGVASAAIVLFYGGGFWDIMQLWLGPILLISSLSLVLSMLLGSLLAMSIAFLVEASQSLAFGISGHTSMLEFSFSSNWQTSPILLLLAVLSLSAALFYAPREPRFATV